MFNGAKTVVVTGGSFVANADGSPKSHLDKLVDQVAPDAILNAGGRADEVRCFPGTREEVIARLEQFMDGESPSRKRIMWLSGPAGAGKSAICQTVAERRKEQGRQAANFFFFRGDSTRGYSKPLVPTLVYQLRQFYPALDELLSDYLATDPLIGSASIEKQFKQLVSSPFQTIQQSTPILQQIVIIIDGLDECSNDEREQDQILAALHTLAHADHSPFLILVSSRAEPQLVMSFNHLGSSAESIFLNEDYQPRKDIRRFVVEKFGEIKKNHHLARTLSAEWPTDADIDSIVDKSSNHFIYAATVMRYIQFSSSNPALSLLTILEMRPFTGDHNPFSHLDAIYSYIFSKVQNIRAVKLIILARICTKFSKLALPADFGLTLKLVGYERMEIESFFADLGAVIQVTPDFLSGSVSLEFHHASLHDYLQDKSRSTIYYVYGDEIATQLCSMCLRNIHDDDSIRVIANLLYAVGNPTPDLSKSLLDASTKCLNLKKGDLPMQMRTLLFHIQRLYSKHHKAQFKALVQAWSRFVYTNKIEEFLRDKIYPQARDPSVSQYYEQYWMTEKYGQRKMVTPPDFAPVGYARRSTQITSARASLNAVIVGPVRGSSNRKPGAFPQNIPAAPSKGRGGNRAPAGISRSSTSINPSWASSSATIGSSTRSLSVWKPKISSPNTRAAPPRDRGVDSHGLMSQPQVSSTTCVNFSRKKGETGRRRVENDDGPNELSMIWVKIHYQDEIRAMTLNPDMPFSEFVNKITVKFGKNFNDLTMKFKDKDGDKITLRDDSDYEFAIETARKTSKGRAEGTMEIWCQDSAR